MMFKQKSTIDINKIKEGLTEILSIDIQKITVESQPSKHNNVYRIQLATSHEEFKSLILKTDYDSYAFEFYKYVLEPYNLDSPKMYGIFEYEDWFLVMEYIPHETLDVESEVKYKRAIDWLIKKDSILNENLNKILPLPYIEPSVWTIDYFLEKIQKGVEAKAHTLLTEKSLETIRSQFQEVKHILENGKQTICHNDFIIQNILFGAGQKRDALYVIDWTTPNIGSVCIDLATLIYYSPSHIKSNLVERYRKRMDFKEFEEEYKAAEAYAKLYEFRTMVNVLIDGRKGTVNTKKFCDLLRELQQTYFL